MSALPRVDTTCVALTLSRKRGADPFLGSNRNCLRAVPFWGQIAQILRGLAPPPENGTAAVFLPYTGRVGAKGENGIEAGSTASCSTPRLLRSAHPLRAYAWPLLL